MKKERQLKRPLSRKIFEEYKQVLLTKGVQISRTELCKICKFLKYETLKGMDSNLMGIKEYSNPTGREAFYGINSVIEFIEENYTKKEELEKNNSF